MTTRMSALLLQMEEIAARLEASPDPDTARVAAVDLRSLVTYERRHAATREASAPITTLPMPGEKGPTP